MTTEKKLIAWESSANAMMMQGDVQEQGYAEKILELIDLVRKQQRMIEKKNEALKVYGSGNDCQNYITLLDKITNCLTITMENIKDD
jgi:hypothetical protein